MVDPHRVRHVGRVVQVVTVAVGQVDAVDDRGRGGDQVEVELALQPLLDDLEVQQAEEAAAEAEAERRRGLRLVVKLASLSRSLAEALAQLLVIGGVGREQAAEHHRQHGLKPGSGSAAGRRSSVIVSPTWQSATALMPAVMKPISPGPSRSTALRLRREDADPLDLVARAGRHQADLLAASSSRPSLTRTRITTPR